MTYLLFILCFILGLLFKRSKFVQTIMISYIYIVMAFNVNNPDYENYSSGYYFVGIGEYTGWIKDYGYLFIIELANKFSLDYSGFLAVFFAICLFLLVKIINLYSYSPNAVLSLFMLYPLAINTVQTRSFLAMLIVMYAVQYLRNFNFKNVLKYVLCLGVAATLHLSTIFFSILMILYVKRKSYLFVLAIFSFFLVIILLPYLAGIIDGFTEGKLDGYIENNYVTLNKIIRVMFFGLTITMLTIFLKKHLAYVSREQNSYNYNALIANSALIILPVSVLAILFSNEFERFSRVGYIFVYILFFNFMASQRIRFISKFFGMILFFFSIVSYFYYQYFFRASDGIPFAEAVFQQILEYNSLIGIYNER